MALQPTRLGRAKFRTLGEYIQAWSHSPNSFFKPSFYLRVYTVIPISVWILFDWSIIAFFTITGFTKEGTDIRLSRRGFKHKHQGELTELLLHPKNRKFLTIHQYYHPNPELYDLYEQMRKAAEECK